jgi:DNA-binding MarR family transcriptional regulator
MWRQPLEGKATGTRNMTNLSIVSMRTILVAGSPSCTSVQQLRLLTMNLYDLYQRPGFLLRRTHQISTAVFENACATLTLTPAQYGVLRVLEQEPDLDQTRLARALAFDKVTMMRICKGLEARGRIARRPSTVSRQPSPGCGRALGRGTADAQARPGASGAGLQALDVTIACRPATTVAVRPCCNYRGTGRRSQSTLCPVALNSGRRQSQPVGTAASRGR